MTIALNLGPEQQQIVHSMRKALRESFPVARLRGAHRTSPDRARLPTLAGLGVFGLAAPEDAGGTGCTVVEEMLLCVELGRFLVTPTALATALAGRLALAAGQGELAQQFVAGTHTVCVATALRPFASDALAGVPAHLLDPVGASHALLWNDSGLALLRLDGLDATPVAGMDRSAQLHRCVLADAAVVARRTDPALVLQAHLANAAMLLGMAEAALEMAVEYAKVRTQFGQAIGSFQAVKHRCADMAIRVEALQAQLALAAIAVRDGWTDAQLQVDACRLLAPRAALANARDNIQVHGAIGFTAECDAHLYLLRAHLHEHLGGPLDPARLARPVNQPHPAKETARCA